MVELGYGKISCTLNVCLDRLAVAPGYNIILAVDFNRSVVVVSTKDGNIQIDVIPVVADKTGCFVRKEDTIVETPLCCSPRVAVAVISCYPGPRKDEFEERLLRIACLPSLRIGIERIGNMELLAYDISPDIYWRIVCRIDIF